MFVATALVVGTIAYWCSALVAEIVMTSRAERELGAAVRAAIGLFFLIVYFAGAWQLMSIDEAWLVGLALLAIYAAGNRRAIADRPLGRVAAAHLRGYLACAAAVVVFFAPLLLTGHDGPFTEGGGDITIYSDVPKLLTDNGMTSFGQVSHGLDRVESNLRMIAHVGEIDKYKRYQEARAEFVALHRDRLNPPVADSQAYRTVAEIFFSSIYYSPYAFLYFVSAATNYPVYFGIQALLYAFGVVAIWLFFRPFGTAAAVLAAAAAVASHGIASVYYNGYSMHGISLAASGLFIYLAPRLRPLSAAGIRAYGVPLVVVGLCYTHYLSILVPLVVAAALIARLQARSESDSVAAAGRLMRTIPAVVTGAMAYLVIVSSSPRAVSFIVELLETWSLARPTTAWQTNWLGQPISHLSPYWLSFAFGLLSQQHVHPFATEQRWVMIVVFIGAGIGVACLALALAQAALAAVSTGVRTSPGAAQYLILFATLVATIAIHLYLAKSSLYTQAKGAQDILLLLYAALVLPFAFGSRLAAPQCRIRLWTVAFAVMLAAFIATLASARVVYGWRLAAGEDRAAVLERSFFAEARRIRHEDDHAFVLFEPRKSGDLYVSIQPFAGMRMVPTRDLALTLVDVAPRETTKRRIEPSQLVESRDIAHLWTLSAVRHGGRYAWHGERIAQRNSPAVYLFGDDYEQDFGRKPRSAEANDVGMFSYVRNGSAMVLLPAGGPYRVEVRLMARSSADDAALRREIEMWVANGEVVGSVGHEGRLVSLARVFPPSGEPRLARVARFSGEYWLNARVDGRDLLSASQALRGEKVSGRAMREGGETYVEAAWSGVEDPDDRDWIGIYPFGGDDQSRLTFSFTAGKRAGTLKLRLPPGAVLPSYEIRLYRAASSTTPAATSEPVAGPT